MKRLVTRQLQVVANFFFFLEIVFNQSIVTSELIITKVAQQQAGPRIGGCDWRRAVWHVSWFAGVV